MANVACPMIAEKIIESGERIWNVNEFFDARSGP